VPQQIQCRPLGAKDRSGVAAEQGRPVSDPNAITVGRFAVDLDGCPVLGGGSLEHGDGRLEAGEHAVLLDHELGLARRAFRDRRTRRDIAAGRIFAQGEACQLFVWVCHVCSRHPS